MAEGLANLVEGYVAGQQLHMKKAREVADKAAEDWSRQFKVQQAKSEAAQQEIKNRQEQERIGIEHEAQKRLAEQAKATEQHKEHLDKIAEERVKLQRDISNNKIDFSDYSQKLKRQGQIYDGLIKQGVTPDLAQQGAQQILSDEINAFEQRLSAQQGAGQSPAAQGGSILSGTGNPLAQPPAQTGNPIMDAIHQLHGHNVQAPGERPDFLSHQTPKQAADAALEQARTQQAQASEQRQKAIAAILTENKELNQRALQAKTALTEANRKKVEREIEHSATMEPEQIANLKARTIKLGIDAQVEVSNAHVNVLREQRQQAESDLKSNPKDATAKNRLLDALNKARTSHLHLNEEMMKNVKMSADLDIKINKARKDGDFTTMRTATDMKKATDNQLADLTNSYREQLNEYTAAQKAVKEFGIREVTTPSGGAAHKANDADTRSLGAAQRQAERLRPMPVIPPGTPPVPGAQPGLYARPRQSAPSSRPGLKKKFKAMSKDELKKYIKAHGG